MIKAILSLFTGDPDYTGCPTEILQNFIHANGGEIKSVRQFSVGELNFTTLADARANRKRGQTIFVYDSTGRVYPVEQTRRI